MIHPNTELKYISDAIGYGVFATEFIPEGTIVYMIDGLEQIIKPSEYAEHCPDIRSVIDKYAYIDEKGNRIVSWDFAKYVNHCCNCNTISTGYGFEIAIRDIQKGEEITDEYAIFNLGWEMELTCDQPNCRGKMCDKDFDLFYENWDAKIKKSLPKLIKVDQPLISLIDRDTRHELDQYFENSANYKSVYNLKLAKNVQAGDQIL